MLKLLVEIPSTSTPFVPPSLLLAMSSPAKSLNDLFKEISKPGALAHHSRKAVLLLSEHLFAEDCMGLRGYGVPRDEYEPEAELALAYAFGLQDREQLWEKPARRPHPGLSRSELEDCLVRTFKVLFGEDLPVSSASVDALAEALDVMCVAEEEEEKPACEISRPADPVDA